MNGKIPPEFIDLADGPLVAALTTVMPDGQPQTTAVWCDLRRRFRTRQHDARLSQREEYGP